MIPPLKSTETTETTETETLSVKLLFHLKSCISMKYDISKATAPAMAKLGKAQNVSV